MKNKTYYQRFWIDLNKAKTGRGAPEENASSTDQEDAERLYRDSSLLQYQSDSRENEFFEYFFGKQYNNRG